MLTAIVLTHNEESTIDRCIASLTFCDEILVIDDNSTDKTAGIAQANGATVISHPLNNDFAAQRNFAIDQAKNDWILMVDADEVVSDQLQKEIHHTIQLGANEAYYLRRRDHFWGRAVTHGEVATAYIEGFIRLFKKGSGKWEGSVHEQFVTDKNVSALQAYIDHYPHPDVTSFLNSINKYSTLRARELDKSKYQVSVFEILAFPFGKFMYTYFIKQGYLDGPPGFVYSFMMSFHSFLVRSKLYQYQKIDR